MLFALISMRDTESLLKWSGTEKVFLFAGASTCTHRSDTLAACKYIFDIGRYVDLVRGFLTLNNSSSNENKFTFTATCK